MRQSRCSASTSTFQQSAGSAGPILGAALAVMMLAPPTVGQEKEPIGTIERPSAGKPPLPPALFEALAFEAAELGALLAPSPHGELIVLGVKSDSAAARAGLRAGDFILSIGDVDVTSAGELAQLMKQEPRPETATLEIWRGGKKLERRILLSHPDDSSMSPRRPFAGIKCDEVQAGGLIVRHVLPGGPAAKAGLQIGDILKSASGTPLETLVDAEKFLRQVKPHQSITLNIERDGQQQSVELKLASLRISDQGDYLEAEPVTMSGKPLAARPAALQVLALERDRRIAEQHHRLERLMQEVRAEIRALHEKLELLEKR